MMSSKSTITLTDGFHIYKEELSGNICIQIDDRLGLEKCPITDGYIISEKDLSRLFKDLFDFYVTDKIQKMVK